MTHHNAIRAETETLNVRERDDEGSWSNLATSTVLTPNRAGFLHG